MGEMLTKLYRLVCHAVWQFSQHFIYFINTIINLVKKPSIKCFKLFFEGKQGRAIANCFGYPSFLGFVYFNFFQAVIWFKFEFLSHSGNGPAILWTSLKCTFKCLFSFL